MTTYEKSVKGATKIKLAAPKSKYIEDILRATQSGEAGVADVFRTLQLRIRDSTWTIAFKALVVVHMMIRDGAPDVTLSYLAGANPRKLVGVSTYTDAPSRGGLVTTGTNVQTQGRNIRNYSAYLIARAQSFSKAKTDYVRDGAGRFKKLTIDKGLLRETEIVQDQIQPLVGCDFLADEPENDITIAAFRLLTLDLVALYEVMNEGMINILERFFELSRPDAERSLSIYKAFTRITELTVRFLATARQLEQITRLSVPKLKHAPTSLSQALEDYLNDRDFETNRRQYIAQQQVKKGIKPSAGASPSSLAAARSAAPSNTSTRAVTAPTPSSSTAQQPTKAPPADLIDFFESIEQHQQPLPQQTSQMYAPAAFAQYQQPAPVQNQNFTSRMTQPVNVAPSNTGNPFDQFTQPQQFQQTQPQFTGASYGGYPPQSQPPQQQQAVQPQMPFGTGFGNRQFQQQPFVQTPPTQQSFVQNPPQQQPEPLSPQQTNPFRQSTFSSNTGFGQAFSPQSSPPASQLGKNPFARPPPIPENSPAQFPDFTGSQTNFSAFAGAHSNLPDPTANEPQRAATFPIQNQTARPLQGLQTQQTGTNPFAGSSPFTAQPPSQTSTVSPFGGVSTNTTGSTNPFRQSAFVNQQTGQGWQNNTQGTMGGLENLPTIPVFPRPGQPQPQQQQQSWL